MDAGLGAAFQLAFNAAALGAAYALVALGFVLVINAIGTVNFAHGHLVMAGGFAAVALSELWAVPGIVLLPAVFILMALLGAILHFIAYRPLSSAPPTRIRT